MEQIITTQLTHVVRDDVVRPRQGHGIAKRAVEGDFSERRRDNESLAGKTRQ